MRIKKATIKEDENAAECVCAIDGRPIVQGPQFSGPYHQLLFHVTRRAQELVLPDAAFREMRQARWSPQDSNSFRKPACCRLPGLPGGSIDPASDARRRCRELDHALRRSHR